MHLKNEIGQLCLLNDIINLPNFMKSGICSPLTDYHFGFLIMFLHINDSNLLNYLLQVLLRVKKSKSTGCLGMLAITTSLLI